MTDLPRLGDIVSWHDEAAEPGGLGMITVLGEFQFAISWASGYTGRYFARWLLKELDIVVRANPQDE